MTISNWKISQDGLSISRTLDNGYTESCSISVLDAAELAAVIPVDLPTLPQVQSERIAILSNAYNTAIQVPVAYMGATFQADDASQSVLTKVLVAGSVPAGFAWLDANNTPVNMTYAQLQGLAVAMLAQGQAAFVKLQTLKSQVRAATTVIKAQAIVW